MSLLDGWEEETGSTGAGAHQAEASSRNPFLSDEATPPTDPVSSRNPFLEDSIQEDGKKPPNPFAEETDDAQIHEQAKTTLNPFGDNGVDADDSYNSYESVGENAENSLQRMDGVRVGSTDSLFSLGTAPSLMNGDLPNFHLHQVDIDIGTDGSSKVLKTMVSGGGILVLALETAEGVHVYVWNGTSNHQLGLSLKSGENVNLFIDAQGRHVLISVENGENYYYNPTKLRLLPNTNLSSKVQHHALKVKGPLKSLKNVVIESASFDLQSCNDASAVVLLGTRTGDIYEAIIGEQKCKEKHIKHIYKLRDDIPICGLKCERFPMLDNDSSKHKWFVMAVTARPTRYYQFIGGPNFEEMFAKYNSAERRMFVELPSNLGYSQLHFYTKYLQERAKSFTILTGAGIFHGTLSFGSQESGEEVVKVYDMLSFPTETNSGFELTDPPLCMEETQFLFVLLYPSWLIVVNKLNESIVFEKDLSHKQGGLTLGLSRDYATGSIWVYSSSHVHMLKIDNEDGNVWRLYLEKAERDGSGVDFNTALSYAKNDRQKDMVLTVQANYYFNTNNFELAARYYAESSRSFEEVALMLLSKGQKDALKSYLLLKLKALPVESKTQRTILSVWITDIFLDKLNHISKMKLVSADYADSDSEDMGIDITKSKIDNDKHIQPAEKENDESWEEESARVQQEFWKFLNTYQSSLEPAKETVFNMISSHGRVDELVFYAKLIQDYDRVITHHMQRGDYDKAIDVLLEQSGNLSSTRSLNNIDIVGNQNPSLLSSSDVVQQLYYKYSPVLMEHCPEATVDAWIEAQFLDPCKLIPALVRYTQQYSTDVAGTDDNKEVEGPNQNEAIRYLEYCVKDNGNTDEAIHNYLLSLYAAQDNYNENLLEFVQWPDACFDEKYALRVCTEHGKKEACVHIYSCMHLYEEAVDLALSVDIELAKDNANKAEDDATKKMLWIKIARNEIEKANTEGKSNVKEALAILKESQILRIEDVMVYFSDFVRIDEFKDEICDSLEQYNANIDQLKAEMNDYTKTAETIRNEIEEQNVRFELVSSTQTCDLCGNPVLSGDNNDSTRTLKTFYVFPCTHAFHADCLLDEVSRHLRDEQRAHVDIFRKALEKKQLNIQSASKDRRDSQRDVTGYRRRTDEMTKAEREAETVLHDFLSAACPFCGDLMIQSISEPFISPDERAEALTWEI